MIVYNIYTQQKQQINRNKYTTKYTISDFWLN